VEQGEWNVAGVRASRKLSNLLDELHKEIMLWSEGRTMLFRVKP
jgi:hypothetical protein